MYLDIHKDLFFKQPKIPKIRALSKMVNVYFKHVLEILRMYIENDLINDDIIFLIYSAIKIIPKNNINYVEHIIEYLNEEHIDFLIYSVVNRNPNRYCNYLYKDFKEYKALRKLFKSILCWEWGLNPRGFRHMILSHTP